MGFFIRHQLLLFLSTLITKILSSGPYECGEHGRFEYCIDEIPGCVIGCHCHPGFYFDTDSKICEPNTKLLEHHKQQSLAKLIRRNMKNTSLLLLESPSTSRIDDQVKEIKKNTDDLGDWLYNQFFSTIENQVVNITNKTDLLTRRTSENSSLLQNKKMEKKKKMPQKLSIRKYKKGIIKREFGRFTENDSIFDITSSSESDFSKSTSSDTSADIDSDANGHNHKRLLMLTKRTKPLPSFIFLPNMETPFYPPLGLPPPPVMPMYPMVPVPPVLPIFPMPVPETTTTTPASETTTETTAKTTTKITVKTTKETTIKTTTEPTNVLTSTSIESTTPEVLPDYPNYEDFVTPASTRTKTIQRTHPKSKFKSKLKNAARQNTMQRFRDLKAKNQDIFRQPLTLSINEIDKEPVYQEADDMTIMETPIIDNVPETFLTEEINRVEPLPLANNVNFKYISELIHKDDVNKINNQKNNGFYPMNNFKSSIRKLKPKFIKNGIQNIRRADSLNRSQENLYYSNIGRQIASLIRNIDTHNMQNKFKINEANNKNPNTLIFKDDSPTSFWERSVRSPLSFLNSYKNKVENSKRSNELLFNLENKVEIIATTPGMLSLQEIENVVNVIENAKKQMEKKEQVTPKNFLRENRNFNVNLLPEESHSSDNNNYYKLQPSRTLNRNRNIDNNIINSNPPNNFVYQKPFDYISGIHIKNISRLTVWHNTKEKEDIRNNNAPNTQTSNDKIDNYYYNNSFGDRAKPSNIQKQNLPFSPKQYLRFNKLNPMHTSNYKQYPNNINLNLLKRTTYRPERSFYHPTYFLNEIEPF